MTVKDIHKQAMKYNDLAIISKKENPSLVEDYFLKAFEYEKQAFILFSSQSSEEPTRSILLRSTANLALQAGILREAEKFVALGLAGETPEDIADELRDIFQQINFHRHLDLKGVKLNNDELQFSLSGNEVGHGIIRSSEFLSRIEVLEKLSFRTAERLRNEPFAERINKNKSKVLELDAFISTPRAASFAVTIKYGQPTNIPTFDGMESQLPLIDDLFKNIKLVNENDEIGLMESIKDEAYRNNFIALTKELLPDGDKINLVGLTIIRNEEIITLPVTRTKSNIGYSLNPKKINESIIDNIEENVELTGILSFADSKHSNIKLTDSDKKDHTIIVPKGLLSDVVKPYFEEEVIIFGTRTSKGILMKEIDRV